MEIRFTLEREGDYAGAEYGFSWVQTDGKGTLRDSRGMYYTDREEYELRVVPDLDVSDPLAWRFTLWYRPTGSDDPSLRFIVTDNFRGAEHPRRAGTGSYARTGRADGVRNTRGG